MPDLTTLAEVKRWHAIPATITTSDALLADLISATSADFLRAIARPDLLGASYTEHRVGDGSVRLVLRHWPIQTVESLTLAGVATAAQTDTVDGWYIDTDTDPERQFVLFLSGNLLFPDGGKVSLTYVAGYPETPGDIAQAVTEWVVYRYTRKSNTGQTQSRGVEGESARYEEFDIPPNTKRVIAAYKRKFAPYGTDEADSGIGDGAGGGTQRSNRASAASGSGNP